ncbi:DUF2232 domain-containing protein [Paenibacillus validus]|uniref:DUF2232 domain-containing protein n=1 Tax=Paenibacillus validus TaxID=44253 RepID=UPI000FDB7FE0|nr:DUF2232 domain-containing protein [Paenibacillus validus]MED4600575.1 DUF2232 domain-containing protein [Paenibacillus validus]MED4605584.1 DUF2232 domain-containing protein [Paenibacillus validus]
MEETQKPRMLGWSIVYIVLLLSLMAPLLNLVTFFFLLVPVLVLYVRLGTKSFLIHYLASLAIVYVLVSFLLIGWIGAMLVSVSLFLLPPVIQMGNLYKKRAPARSVLNAGAVTLLIELLISLVVAHLFGLNPVGAMKRFMIDSFNLYSPQMKSLMGVDIDTIVHLSVQMLPMYMITFSLLYAVISHAATRRVLVRLGESVPAFRPIKDWKLPKSFIWIYVVALVLELFTKDMESTLFTVVLNLLPLLSTAFAIQAISFLFFVAHMNRWNKTLPIVGIALLLLFPPLFFLFSLIGVFDVAFPIRDRITRKE